MALYLVVVCETQPVAMFVLDVLHQVLPLLLLGPGLSVGVELQPRGHRQVVCNPRTQSKARFASGLQVLTE